MRHRDLPTFLGSERALARYVVRPIADFLHVEAAGGILLLVATVVALVWANSPWSSSYHDLWHTVIEFKVASFAVEEDLLHAVNDGLMAIFFFVVGLEIKRELITGELRDPRSAVLPGLAALGGMVVPALIYLAFNLGGAGSSGWGIPMATDIAFALGVLSLLGPRVPSSLKVFLLTLAIVDDIGAITVIAIFYTADLSVLWLMLALVGLLVVVVMRRLHVWYIPLYVVVGTFVWFATFESGIHATIAGVALGLITPARPLQPPRETQAALDRLGEEVSGEHLDPRAVRSTAFLIRESTSVAERLEQALHPWSSYLIIPVFALANAGISLSAGSLSDAVTSNVTLGVAVGLIVGKTIGVAGFTLIASRLGLGRLPAAAHNAHVAGLAMISGIGFTVSLFIAGLAFDEMALEDEAKIGILLVSVVAAVAGAAVLAVAGRRTPPEAVDLDAVVDAV